MQWFHDWPEYRDATRTERHAMWHRAWRDAMLRWHILLFAYGGAALIGIVATTEDALGGDALGGLAHTAALSVLGIGWYVGLLQLVARDARPRWRRGRAHDGA